jgi:hypothetical protein
LLIDSGSYIFVVLGLARFGRTAMGKYIQAPKQHFSGKLHRVFFFRPAALFFMLQPGTGVQIRNRELFWYWSLIKSYIPTIKKPGRTSRAWAFQRKYTAGLVTRIYNIQG